MRQDYAVYLVIILVLHLSYLWSHSTISLYTFQKRRTWKFIITWELAIGLIVVLAKWHIFLRHKIRYLIIRHSYFQSNWMFNKLTTSARFAPSLSPWRAISLTFLANERASGSIFSRASVTSPWITQVLQLLVLVLSISYKFKID